MNNFDDPDFEPTGHEFNPPWWVDAGVFVFWLVIIGLIVHAMSIAF